MNHIRKVFTSAMWISPLTCLLLLPFTLFCKPLTLAPSPAMKGIFAPNSYLAAVEKFNVGGHSPEDVAIDSNGFIYVGLYGSKRIMKINPDGTNPRVFATVPGTPLGLDFDAAANLIVADEPTGLLSVSPAGKVTVLTRASEGRRITEANDVEVAPDGKIYFSELTWKYGYGFFWLDFLEGKPHGRLMVYDPADKSTHTLLSDLYMANGVAVAPDNSFVLVNETNASRTRRYWLSGPKTGKNDIFIENLPGSTDGISRGTGGIFWMALPGFRETPVEKPKAIPMWKMMRDMPPNEWLVILAAQKRSLFVLGLDQDGKVIFNLQGPADKFSIVTSVQEANGYLYLGTIMGNEIGRVKRP